MGLVYVEVKSKVHIHVFCYYPFVMNIWIHTCISSFLVCTLFNIYYGLNKSKDLFTCNLNWDVVLLSNGKDNRTMICLTSLGSKLRL